MLILPIYVITGIIMGRRHDFSEFGTQVGRSR